MHCGRGAARAAAGVWRGGEGAEEARTVRWEGRWLGPALGWFCEDLLRAEGLEPKPHSTLMSWLEPGRVQGGHARGSCWAQDAAWGPLACAECDTGRQAVPNGLSHTTCLRGAVLESPLN